MCCEVSQATEEWRLEHCWTVIYWIWWQSFKWNNITAYRGAVRVASVYVSASCGVSHFNGFCSERHWPEIERQYAQHVFLFSSCFFSCVHCFEMLWIYKCESWCGTLHANDDSSFHCATWKIHRKQWIEKRFESGKQQVDNGAWCALVVSLMRHSLQRDLDWMQSERESSVSWDRAQFALCNLTLYCSSRMRRVYNGRGVEDGVSINFNSISWQTANAEHMEGNRRLTVNLI